MAPALVGTPGTAVYSAASVATPTTLTPDTGTGYAIDDVILCFTACRAKAPTVAASGWTTLADVTGSSLFHIGLFGKVATSTSEAAPSVVWSSLTTGAAGDPVGAVCQAFTGLDGTVDVLGATVQSGNSAVQAGAGGAITTLTDNALVLHLAVRSDDIALTWSRATFTNVTGGAGAGASLFTASGSDMAGQWAYLVKTPAGVVAQVNFDISGGSITSSPSMGVQVGLKAGTPAAPPAPAASVHVPSIPTIPTEGV